jgi:UPF0716 protein FxsA
MRIKLLALFVVVPLLELALLIRVGNLLGFWVTMAIVIVTAMVGASLARSQGTRVLREIRRDLTAGRVPASNLLDGLLVLIGGIVLLTPGFITDLVGLALLLPFTRSRLKRAVARRFEGLIRSGRVQTFTLIR